MKNKTAADVRLGNSSNSMTDIDIKTADVRLGNSSNSTTDIDMKTANVRLDNNVLLIDCQSSSQQITDYFAGELSPPISEQLMAHLETCEACRKEFEEFDELWSHTGEVLAEDSIIEQLSDERKDFIANAKTLAAQKKKKSPTVTRRIIEYGAVAAILLIFAGMLLPALNSARGRARRISASSNLDLVKGSFKDAIILTDSDDDLIEDAAGGGMTESAAGGGEGEVTTQALNNYRDGVADKSNRGRTRHGQTKNTSSSVIVLSSKVAKKTVPKQESKQMLGDSFVDTESDDTFGIDSNQFAAPTTSRLQRAGRRSASTLKKTAGRLLDYSTLGKDVKHEVAPMVLEESLGRGASSKPIKSKAKERQYKSQISSSPRPGAKSLQMVMEKRLNQPQKIIIKADKMVLDSSALPLETRKKVYVKERIAESNWKSVPTPVQRKVFKVNLKLWNITTTQNLRVLMQERGCPLTARVSINRHDNTITFYDTAANLMKAAKLFSKLQAAEKELKDFRNGIPMLKTKLRPVSTFSIDTDTASYVQAKRMIMNGQRPDPMKIREEEFINYFDYHYRSPKKNVFGVYLEAAPTSFRSDKVLLRIGVQGKKLGPNSGTASRYTVLFDGSGSMAAGNRLELAFQTLQLLFKRLTVNDRVSLIVCNEKPVLLFSGKRMGKKTAMVQEFNRIKPTGAADFNVGLKMAYRSALHNYLPGGINKVIIISDGIVKLPKKELGEVMTEIDRSRRRGISNIVIGVGGDGDDQLLEKLAAAGDGSYVFIDRQQDAIELFNQQFDARFREIARDVKIQVEFNSIAVPEYRQVGYRNRQLSKADFRNDKINAGEVGSGQSVTALYEMKLNRELPAKTILAIVRLRYKPIDSDEVIEEEFVITSNEVGETFAAATPGFKLAALVAEFAESLRYPETPDIASGSGIATILSPLLYQNFRNDGKVAELLILTRKVK